MDIQQFMRQLSQHDNVGESYTLADGTMLTVVGCGNGCANIRVGADYHPEILFRDLRSLIDSHGGFAAGRVLDHTSTPWRHKGLWAYLVDAYGVGNKTALSFLPWAPGALWPAGVRAINDLLQPYGLDMAGIDASKSCEIKSSIVRKAARASVTLPDELLTEIGNLCQLYGFHVPNSITFDFDDRLNWSAGEFGDYGSCYWGSNSHARDMLRENGALAFRLYDSHGDGIARAWLCPAGDNIILYNGYGLNTRNMACLLAYILGAPVTPIRLTNNGQSSGLLYINSAAGFWIGDIPADPDTVDNCSLRWRDTEKPCVDLCYDDDYDPMATCDNCGCAIDEYDVCFVGDTCLCNDCYCELTRGCERCGEAFWAEDAVWCDDSCYCEYCADRVLVECYHCEERMHDDTANHDDSDRPYCDACFDEQTVVCDYCGGRYHADHMVELDSGVYVCQPCDNVIVGQCTLCTHVVTRETSTAHVNPLDGTDYHVCNDCQRQPGDNQLCWSFLVREYQPVNWGTRQRGNVL